MESDLHSFLVQMNPDGTFYAIATTIAPITKINCVGDRVYFSSGSDIASFLLDGGEAFVETVTDNIINDFVLEEDDGAVTSIETACENRRCIKQVDKYLYIGKEKNIEIIDRKTQTRRSIQVIETGNIQSLEVIGTTIYACSEKELVTIRPKSNQPHINDLKNQNK